MENTHDIHLSVHNGRHYTVTDAEIDSNIGVYAEINDDGSVESFNVDVYGTGFSLQLNSDEFAKFDLMMRVISGERLRKTVNYARNITEVK
jgi:hypothetical protein